MATQFSGVKLSSRKIHKSLVVCKVRQLVAGHCPLTTGHCLLIPASKQNRERSPVPGLISLCGACENLLRLRLFVQFDTVAGVHILHGKHDHSRGRGRRGPDDDNLAYRAPRQIPHVNYRTI
jgi:hypothetical protein